jgi:hypothetical protein
MGRCEVDRPEPIQVCQKGHLVNESAEFDPYANRKFCASCGSETTLCCSGCGTKITSADANPYRQVVIPAYCCECGKPFPWTETAIQAAFEFTDELDALDSQEKSALKAAVPDLVSDTARTPLAISRVQTLFAKIGKPAAQTLSQILVSVLTEEAKRQLGLK